MLVDHDRCVVFTALNCIYDADCRISANVINEEHKKTNSVDGVRVSRSKFADVINV